MNTIVEIKNKEIAMQDKVSNFYDEERYLRPYSKEWHKQNIKKMVTLIDKDKLNRKILDNGCGIGILGDYLPDRDITGSDISSEMLKKAKSRIKALVLADSEKLPFIDNTFDVIFARSLLHHLPNPQKGIDECFRVLRPGGQIVFQDTLMSIFSYIPRKIANWQGKHFSESHKNFRRQEILNLVGSKLKIEKVMFSGYAAYLLGFPDVFDIAKFIPAKKYFIPFLYILDCLIERIPVIHNQSWGIIILAKRLPDLPLKKISLLEVE